MNGDTPRPRTVLSRLLDGLPGFHKVQPPCEGRDPKCTCGAGPEHPPDGSRPIHDPGCGIFEGLFGSGDDV